MSKLSLTFLILKSDEFSFNLIYAMKQLNKVPFILWNNRIEQCACLVSVYR